MRAFLVRWHRRLALGFAVLLLMQFLTGILLVFREEIVALGLPPSAADGERATAFAPLENAVRGAYPAARLLAAQFPSAATRDFIFSVEQPDGAHLLVAIDPRELRPQPLGGVAHAVEWIRGLHEDLALGKAGRLFVGAEALVLLTLVVSGWILWWPGVARLASGLRLPLHGPARFKLFYWHRTFGSIVGVLLLPSLVTGFMLTIGAFLPSWTPNVAPPAERAASNDARLVLARSLFPTLAIREVRFDAASGALSRVVLREPGVGLRAPITDVGFDPIGGQIVTVVDRQRLAGYDRVASWGFPIHSAQVGGAIARTALFATGIAATTLASLGLALWAVRRAPRVAVAIHSVQDKG